MTNNLGISGAFSGSGLLLGLLCSAVSAVAQIQPAPAFTAAQLNAPPTTGWLTNGGRDGGPPGGAAPPVGVTLPAGNADSAQGARLYRQLCMIARYVADDLFLAHAQ